MFPNLASLSLLALAVLTHAAPCTVSESVGVGLPGDPAHPVPTDHPGSDNPILVPINLPVGIPVSLPPLSIPIGVGNPPNAITGWIGIPAAPSPNPTPPSGANPPSHPTTWTHDPPSQPTTTPMPKPTDGTPNPSGPNSPNPTSTAPPGSGNPPQSPGNGDDGKAGNGPTQCSTGSLQCCQKVVDHDSDEAKALSGLLGLGLGNLLGGGIGTDCSPINLLDTSSGNACSAKAVCCNGKAEGGLVNIGCVNVVL